jgi:superfamily I DNA/RNA helicase
MLNVFYPENRYKENQQIISSTDEKFRNSIDKVIIELREATRQNDHRFRSLPGNNLWISDIAGRKGGRLLYFRKNNKLIIWGIGPDHNIEDEAERYFTNQDKENNIINGDLIDVTADFLTEKEKIEISRKTKVYAGNLSDNFLKEKLYLSDFQISEIRSANEFSLWDLKIIDDICRYKLWQYQKLHENISLAALNEDHLFGFLKGSNERLMIHLDPYQESIVNQNNEKSILIKGETGSGKTTILIYKAIYYAQAHPEQECILFTFNLSLANMIKEAIEELNGETIINLSIYGFIEWIEEISVNYLHEYRLIEKESSFDRYKVFESLYSEKEIKTLGFKEKSQSNFFLKREIDEVILEYGLDAEKEYLNIHRYGRDKIVGKKQRHIIWKIYLDYLELLQKENHISYNILVKSMLNICRSTDFEFKMDAIFVDEIQDLSPVCIKIISVLRKDKNSLCVLTGDFKQSIYRRSFRWSDVKLPFYGANVLNLKKNYRNTVEILDEACRLTEHFKINWTKPINSGRHGKAVERILYKAENKIAMLKTLINFAVNDQSIDFSDIAIFGVSRQVENLVNLLQKEGIPAVFLRKQDNHYSKNAVKVSTLHSAKGLEFRMVVLINIESELLNFKCTLERQKEINAVKLLYVGMTRAYDCLFFMLKENDNPENKLDKFLYCNQNNI